ncbi:MAG: DMT family transporter [Rhabdochlamydiaceae bacterium]|nr:DMT family transporter [Candidatus Amphrikana amoebophyrae]
MRILLSILLFAMWSLAFPLGRYLVEYASPVFVTGSRMTIAGLLLIGYMFIKKRKSLIISKKQLLSVVILGVISIYLSNVLEFYGLKTISAGKTCFIFSLSPLFAALFSYFHFKEKITPLKWVGLGVGFGAVIPALLSSSPGALYGFGVAELAVAVAALCSVYGWVLLRMIVKDNEMSPLVANGYSMLIGGAIALGQSYMTEDWSPLPIESGQIWPILGGVGVLILISNLLCYNLYGYLLKKMTATLMSFFGLLSPIYASLLSYLILGELPRVEILASTFVVIFGLWLVYKAEQKQGYILAK